MSAPARRSATLPAAAAPLRHRPFRDLWIATFIANLGAWAQAVGAAWLMVEVAGSVDLVAYVQAAYGAPALVLSILAGALADLYERRRVQLAAQAWMLAAAAILAGLALLGLATPAVILVLTLAAGTGAALRAPAWQASIKDLVPERDVPAAVALSSVGFNLSRVIGPAIGGLIVAMGSAAGAFAFHAAASLALILVLARSPAQPRGLAGRRRLIWTSALAGLRYAARARVVRAVMVRAAAVGVPASATLALLPSMARTEFAGGPLLLGALLGSFGFGAVIAALVLPALRRRLGGESLLTGATIAFALSLWALGEARSVAFAVPSLVLGGVAWIVMLTTLNTTVQISARPAFRGRALAAYMTCAFGGLALGSVIWGRLAVIHGTPASLSVAAGVLVAGLALRVWFTLPSAAPRPA